MTATRAYVITAAAACMLLAASSAVQAQDRRNVLVQPPLLPAPERGSVAGALSRLAIGPGDLDRGTFALPAAMLPRMDDAPLRIVQGYEGQPLCARA